MDNFIPHNLNLVNKVPTINQADKKGIEAIVRNSESLWSTKSNIKDVYSIQMYEENTKSGGAEIKVLLDNNIVIRVIPFVVTNKDKNKLLNEDEKLICALMCFFIICNIETNPILAFFERKSESTQNDDYYFRIADFIHPQEYADLALGRRHFLSDGSIIEATNLVKNHKGIQRELSTKHPMSSTNFTNHVGFKLIYQKLLKAYLVHKSNKMPGAKLECFLTWNYDESLTLPNIELFIWIFLSGKDSKINSLIKKINTRDADCLFNNLENTVWDIQYLNMLYGLHERTHNNDKEPAIWLGCTRDKALYNFAQYMHKPDSEENLRGVLNNFYKSKEIDIVIDCLNQTKERSSELSGHKQNVCSNIDNSIISLKDKVRKLINKNN